LAEFYQGVYNDEEVRIKLNSNANQIFIKALTQTWNSQHGELFGKLDESYFDSDKVVLGMNGYYTDQNFMYKLGESGLDWKEINKFYDTVYAKFKSLLADFIIKQYSINPAFKSDVINSQSPYIQYLLEPHKYTDDIVCGKRYHEKYADKTFSVLVELQGIKGANQIHEEIKQILYD